MTLYELTGNWQAVFLMAEDADADMEAIKDTLDAIEEEIEDKADSIAKIIEQLKSDAAICDKEAIRLNERKKAYKNRAANLKKYLEEAMTAMGKPKFKTPLYSFGIQKNAPSVEIEDEEKLIDWLSINKPDWVRVKSEADKKEILSALKAGEKIPYAHKVQTESLRIR